MKIGNSIKLKNPHVDFEKNITVLPGAKGIILNGPFTNYWRPHFEIEISNKKFIVPDYYIEPDFKIGDKVKINDSYFIKTFNGWFINFKDSIGTLTEIDTNLSDGKRFLVKFEDIPTSKPDFLFPVYSIWLHRDSLEIVSEYKQTKVEKLKLWLKSLF